MNTHIKININFIIKLKGYSILSSTEYRKTILYLDLSVPKLLNFDIHLPTTNRKFWLTGEQYLNVSNVVYLENHNNIMLVKNRKFWCIYEQYMYL